MAAPIASKIILPLDTGNTGVAIWFLHTTVLYVVNGASSVGS